MAHVLKLVCGNRELSLKRATATTAGWALRERGGNVSPARGQVVYSGARRTASYDETREIILTMSVQRVTGMAVFQRTLRDLTDFFEFARQAQEAGGRDAVYLVRQMDDGVSGEVLFGRGPLYHEVLAGHLDVPASAYSVYLVGSTANILEMTLTLTCPAFGVGKPPFCAEGTGWYRYTDDNDLTIWRGVTNLFLNPSFEHSTYDTDWAVSDATLVKAVDYERVHQPRDMKTFAACRLCNTDAAINRWYYSTKTLTAAMYTLSCYAYTDGGAVTSSDVVLYAGAAGGSAIMSTAYEADVDNPGWYRLSASFLADAVARVEGVVVKPGKTVTVDNFQLEVLTATNLVQNPGFETAGAGAPDLFGSWTESAGGSTIADEGVTVHAGSHAVKHTTAAPLAGQVSQAFTVRANAPYTLSYWTEGDGVDDGQIQVYDETNGANIIAIQDTGVTAAAYAQVAHNFITPAKCASITVYLHGPSADAGVAYFDDVALYDGSPSPFALGDQGPGLDWDNGAELLANTGFETAGAGAPDVFGSWTETAGDGAIASTGVAGEFYAGAAAAKLTAGATANTLIYQDIVTTADTKYRLNFYARGDGTYNGRFRVYDNTGSADIIGTTATGKTAATYALCSYEFTTPAGCVSVRITLACSATNTGIAYFDAVSVVKLGVAHNATTTRTAGQWRERTLWEPHPGYETLFYGAGALSVWVRTPYNPNDYLAHYAVASDHAADHNRFLLYKSAANVLTFEMYGSTASGYKTLSGSSLWAADTWTHVFVTWDESGPLTLYLNGALADNSATTTGTWTNLDTLGSYVYAGSDTAGAHQWDGDIADLRIWGPDVALDSGKTVDDLYDHGRGKSELAAIWTSAIGGSLDNADDTMRSNYFWIAGLPGDVAAPLRLMFQDANSRAFSKLHLGLRTVNAMPYRLNVLEGDSGGITTADVADAACSNGIKKRVSPAATTEPTTDDISYYLPITAALQYVAGQYKMIARVYDGAAATGVFKTRGYVNGVLDVYGDYTYADAVGGWTLVDLGVFDVPAHLSTPSFAGQPGDSRGFGTYTDQLSLMAWLTSGAALTYDVDCLFLFPAETWGQMVEATSITALPVIILDAITGAAYRGCTRGGVVTMIPTTSIRWDGELPSAPPRAWTFCNIVSQRLTGGPVITDAMTVLGHYQPRYLWGR